MDIKISKTIMKSIFITGGAGYVGTSLIPILLNKEYKVTVYDSLFYDNGDVLIPFINNPNFKFIYGDVRDEDRLTEAMDGHDVVIHLAALVGFPLCKKMGERETTSVNVGGTETVLKHITKDQYLLFGSTGSNYGVVKEICTEETPLNPLSIYGKTKTTAERLIMERDNSTAFRFATAFGISPKMRLDLLVNDLTYRFMTDGYVVIYEAWFMRTFIHVRDMGRSFLFAIENQNDIKNNIYNVGSDEMNFSKQYVCQMIKEFIPNAYINYADIGEDADKRNYIVSYEKIKKLGFGTTITMGQGIQELIRTIPLLKINSKYHNIYNNITF
jgi:nucleoside-diphosphate-sugar epimerase